MTDATSSSARRTRDRDAVVGLRRLRHALRHVPAAGPPARRVRAARRRRRGAPPDRDRARRRAALPLGRGRRPRRRCAAHAAERGLRIGAVNPNLFQDPDYKLGSITHPDAAVRRKAIDHLLECVEIATELGSTAQSLWFADGTNYPGQDDLARAPRAHARCARASSTRRCPPSRSCWSSTSPSSPPSTPPTSPTGAPRCSPASKLGERARVLVDLGHHPQGMNIEQIVALLARRGPARRLPLQQPQVRRRRPDRRLGQPVRAVPDLLRAAATARCRG